MGKSVFSRSMYKKIFLMMGMFGVTTIAYLTDATTKPSYSQQELMAQLQDAMVKGEEAAIEMLLQQNIDLNNPMRWADQTPLIVAILLSNSCTLNYAISLILQNSNLNINYQTTSGKTALMFAAEERNQVVVQLLLDRGADPVIKDANGDTALSLVYHDFCALHYNLTSACERGGNLSNERYVEIEEVEKIMHLLINAMRCAYSKEEIIEQVADAYVKKLREEF